MSGASVRDETQKVAIVTGATSGIGQAAALALAEAGWWTLATGRDESRGSDIAEQLANTPGGGAFLGVDLTDEHAPDAVVERALESRGRLDALVNNAGIHFLGTLPESDLGDLDRLLATNLRAPMLLARAAIAAMRHRDGGVIVNVASEAGLVAVPNQVAYNVSKAGLVMLTRSIAADHAADGIRAVSVCPGTTRTPLVEAAIASTADPDAHERMLAAKRPANRLGRVGEIAAAIVFACSDEASFMTGSELVIDGGYTAV